MHKDLLRWILRGNTLPHGIEFSIPGGYAIANILLTRWAETESHDSSWPGNDVRSAEIDEGTIKTHCFSNVLISNNKIEH